MMIETQSERCASPTVAAPNHSGEETKEMGTTKADIRGPRGKAYDALTEIMAGPDYGDELDDIYEDLKAAFGESDEPREYEMSDGGGGKDMVVCTPDEIEEEWQDWMSGGSWDTEGKTTWCTGWYRDTITGERTSATHTIEPDEPECADGHEHSWRSPYSVLGGLEENPGVWGNGGGAVCKEVCEHCGTYCITDTWAQNPEDGTQGLTSVEYEEADDDSLAYVWRRLAARVEDVTLPDGYTLRCDDARQRLVLVRDEYGEECAISASEMHEIVESGTWDDIIAQLPEIDEDGDE